MRWLSLLGWTGSLTAGESHLTGVLIIHAGKSTSHSEPSIVKVNSRAAGTVRNRPDEWSGGMERLFTWTTEGTSRKPVSRVIRHCSLYCVVRCRNSCRVSRRAADASAQERK